MGMIYTRNAANIITGHSDLVGVGEALTAGETLVYADGNPMQTMEFMGGLLLRDRVSGALLPMNIFLYNAWYPEQKEALEPHWASGLLQRPPATILGLPVIDPAAQSSSMLPLLAAGAIAFFLFRRKR